MVDFEADYTFFDLFESRYKGPEPAELRDALQDIDNQQLPWDKFTARYGWKAILTGGSNTSPKPDEEVLHWFSAVAPVTGNKYFIAGKCFRGEVIVCYIALTEADYDLLPYH